jgi:RNA-directed DNA polymerase
MTTTSIGVQELRARIGAKAKAEPQHRFWGLYTHVWKLDVLREAYRLAKENDGAPGADGVTFAQVEAKGVEKFSRGAQRGTAREGLRAAPEPAREHPEAWGQGEGPEDPGHPRSGGAGRSAPDPRTRLRGGLSTRLLWVPPGTISASGARTVEVGLRKKLHQVIDLDLRSFFDTVRHDLMLAKIARRVRDDDLLWLCKRILKASGKRGLPQGSVIGPLWANVFLDDVDRMLERIQVEAKQGPYEEVRYTRFADDLVVLVSSHPKTRHWKARVEQRLREELRKLDLTINEDKSRTVDFGAGEPFDFLGYTFRWVNQRKDPRKKMVLSRPQKKKRNEFLERLGEVMRRKLSMPVAKVVKQVVNPRVRGWVNYFRWGNSGRDLSYVAWQVDTKVRRFASRQRPKRRGGRSWTTWSTKDIYETWGLFRDYGVAWCSESRGKAT